MAAAKNKNKNKPWKTGARRGHITNLKPFIFETFNIYGIDTQHNQILHKDTQQNNNKCSVQNHDVYHTDPFHFN
jgi:hypothetical protein